MTAGTSDHRVDRLLDAIELVKLDKRDGANQILRELIQEDNNFEEAWLWMSVTVDSVDQSTLCLDNVLRINPDNTHAAGALFRMRASEMRAEQVRSRLHWWRDLCLFLMWSITIALLYAILLTYAPNPIPAY